MQLRCFKKQINKYNPCFTVFPPNLLKYAISSFTNEAQMAYRQIATCFPPFTLKAEADTPMEKLLSF